MVQFVKSLERLVARRTVEKVLNGESKNLKVLNGIADYLEESKKAQVDALKRISDALNG